MKKSEALHLLYDMKLKGSITVFVSGVLIIVISFLSCICECVRIFGAEVAAAAAADASIESDFAEYDKVLFENFGIFGNYCSSIDANADKRKNAINEMLKPAGVFEGIVDTDFWRLEVESSKLNNYCLMTDSNGLAFYEQVVRYMKGHSVSMATESLTDYLSDNESPEITEEYFKEEEAKNNNEIEVAKASNEGEVQEYNPDENEESENKEEVAEPITVVDESESPIEIIKELKKRGVLSLTVPDPKDLSERGLSLENTIYMGQRTRGNLNRNTGFNMDDAGNRSMLVLYLSDKLCDFTNREDTDTGLLYKLEYCIGGKETDIENLKLVVNRLLGIKEAANFTYLISCQEKMAEARMLAAAISAGMGLPTLTEVLKYGILLAWAYAESILDVRNILRGGTSSLVKTGENWKLSLDNIGELNSVSKDEVYKEKGGLSYRTYLRLMLIFVSVNELILRGMDMVEQTMRSKYGREEYRLDYLVVEAEAVSKFYSKPLFMNFKFMSYWRSKNECEITSKCSYF